MKTTTFLLISFLLISCNNNQKVNASLEKKQKIEKTNIGFFKYADFEVFYSNFISDSLFQKQHIEFPLKGSISDCDTTIIPTKKNWMFFTDDIRKYDKSLDRIKLKEGKSQYRLILIRKEVGMLYELRFKKVEDTWYLVYCFIDAC